MRAQEIKHRAQYRRVIQPGVQPIGRQTGQVEQARSPLFIGQGPAQRRQGERAGIWGRGWLIAKNCICPAKLINTLCNRIEDQVAKRILVVEDNDLNRKLFSDVLAANGFAVQPVADGLDALDQARSFIPNLIIMDIQLPNISGLDLIGQIKRDSSLRAIPVLAVTAYAGKGDEERIREAGAEGYLAKPVSIGPFMAAVKSLV